MGVGRLWGGQIEQKEKNTPGMDNGVVIAEGRVYKGTDR